MIVANVIYTLITILVASYGLRWGFTYVVKRQRPDFEQERVRLKQDLARSIRISKWIMRQYWRG